MAQVDPTLGVVYTARAGTWQAPGRATLGTITDPTDPTDPTNPTTPNADWSASNPPWAYTSTAAFTEGWPSGTTIVDLQTGSSDFFTNLQNTVNAAGKRVVVRLQATTYHLSSFRMIGSSGDPTYAFGFWFPNLQGFLGQGADKTFIQMDANSLTQAQLDKMSSLAASAFAPLQLGFARLDGSNSASPVLMGGVTFMAQDQQNITSVQSDVPAVVPQPAPFQGVTYYSGAYSITNNCAFVGSARALHGAPPFETGTVSTSRGSHTFRRCDFDGRLHPRINAARPRRCGPIMANNEAKHELVDSWLHHSNLSRYATNDENSATQGQYIITRCKVEQISNNLNVDPALNNGNSLSTNPQSASAMGWESVNGTVTITDCIISQDSAQATTNGVPQHLQFTTTGSRNPQGGRLYVRNSVFHIASGWSQLEGFLCVRAHSKTYWWLDGVANTLFVYGPSGNRLTAYVVDGTWPPTAAQLSAAGVTPTTHYIVRSKN